MNNPGPKWTILVVGALLIGVAVYFLRDSSEAAYLHSSLRKPSELRTQLCRTWEWQRTVDAYRGGVTMTPEEGAAAEYLTFWPDGTYQKGSKQESYTGHWKLDEEGQTLALLNGVQAARMVRDSDFRHHIRKLNADTLILAWQGRHGEVAELYEAKATPTDQRRPEAMP